MSDATTTATRENWQSHVAEVKQGLIDAQLALIKIENHVGRPLGATAAGLNRKVVNLTSTIERALERLSERQKLIKTRL